MLQKYDKVKSTSLLALAAAGGLAFSGMAQAQTVTPCTPTDGYAAGLQNFVTEIDACLRGADQIETEIAAELMVGINRMRTDAGLAPLEIRSSLQTAAQAHALDMAERQYVSHSDMEGRDHMFRIRALDRSALIGASGAAVMKAGGGADAADILVLMQEDAFNNSNLLSETFNAAGIGIASDESGLLVTILFANVEGEFDQPLPVLMSGLIALDAKLADRGAHKDTWTLTDETSGERIARGNGTRLASGRLNTAQMAELDIQVEDGTSIRTLKGPLVTAR